MKCQSKTPLNYQIHFLKKEKEGKTGLFQGWVAVGRQRAEGRRKG
jgi:hypothetical protein